MSNLTGVTNFFSTANEGFATATSGTISAGATTVPLQSTTGLIDGSVFVGIIEPGTSNQQVFTGTVNLTSSAIVNVIWTRGTNTNHAEGVSVVDYVTGTDFNMMSAGILKQHTQSGAHAALTNTGGLTNAGGLATDTLTASGIATITGLLSAAGGLKISGNTVQLVTGSDGNGGTANYFLLGSIMVAFGITGTVINGNSGIVITFARAFSSAPVTAGSWLYNPTLTGGQTTYVVSPPTTTQIMVGVDNFSGNTSASAKASWWAVGAA